MYYNELKVYKYVCPYCINEVDKCICEEYPESLIQIDKNMVPIIRELNRKWYRTCSSCEGHIGKIDKMYILFSRKHKFQKLLSKNFIIAADHIIGTIPGKTEEAKKRNKSRMLKELFEWACGLEPEFETSIVFALDRPDIKEINLEDEIL